MDDSIDAAADIGCDLSGFSVRGAVPDVPRPGPVEFIPDRNATDRRLYGRLLAADDAPARERIGPDDAAHRNVRDTIDHLLGGKVTKPARDALGKALERADAPPTGRAASDAGIGRAIRLP